MSALTPTSFVSRPMEALAWLVANSATFQGVVSEPDAAGAYNHIYWPEADDSEDPANPGDLVSARPRALITHGESHEIAGEGPGNLQDSGTFYLSFEFIIPDQYVGNPQHEMIWFDNKYGEILAEIWANRGLDDGTHKYLHIHRLARVNGPGYIQKGMDIEADLKRIYGVVYACEWPN